MNYFCNTEFIEYYNTLDLVSVGIITSSGEEYYAISSEYNYKEASEWVKKNVLSNLEDDIKRKTKYEIKQDIADLIKGDKNVKFWGYNCAYDYVILTQLFGIISSAPENWPQYFHELHERANADAEYTQLPHHALKIATWVKEVYDKMRARVKVTVRSPTSSTYKIIQPNP